MCALNGIINLSGSSINTNSLLKKMMDLTSHRGPDSTHIANSVKYSFGYQRLAIVAPESPSGIISDRKISNYTIMFNGEIANYKSIQNLYPNLLGLSDSSVIIPLIEKYGVNDFMKHIHGMFSIAIFDEHSNQLDLVRDPFGVKPLYYYYDDSQVIFSSELKAIASVLDKKPKIRFEAIEQILTNRFNNDRETIYEGIFRVMPGEIVTINHTGMERRYYWNRKPNAQKSALSEKDLVSSISSSLELIMKENTSTDATGGYFLSGGLDSSLLASIGLTKYQESKYQTPISLGFSPNNVEDEKYCKIFENYIGRKIEWVNVSSELARDTLMELVPYLDEPLENPTHIGTYLMSKRAKQLGIKSVITGDGADEFFLGYGRHAIWFDTEEPSKTYPSLNWTITPYEKSLFYKSDTLHRSKQINSKFFNDLHINNLEEALTYERYSRLPEYHNMRLDRMTMAHGIEAKVPFQDSRLVSKTLEISNHDHYGGIGKKILKSVAGPYLPESIINRPKVLFPNQSQYWTKGKNCDWVDDILLSKNARISEWFDTNKLEKILKQHYENEINFGRQAWALLVIELWLNHFDS